MPTTSPAATVAQFKELFPDFAALADSAIQLWFDQFPLRFRVVRFGTQAHMATYAFTAHWITTLGVPVTGSGSGTAAIGTLSNEKVGDLARSYGAAIDTTKVPPGLQTYLSTVYGVMLISIVMSRKHAHARTVRTGSSRIGAVPGSTVNSET